MEERSSSPYVYGSSDEGPVRYGSKPYQPSVMEMMKSLWNNNSEDTGYPSKEYGDTQHQQYTDKVNSDKNIWWKDSSPEKTGYPSYNQDESSKQMWSDTGGDPEMSAPEDKKKKDWSGLAGAAMTGLMAMKKGDENQSRFAKQQFQKDIANMWLMAVGQGMGAGAPGMAPSKIDPYLQAMAANMQMAQNAEKKDQDNKDYDRYMTNRENELALKQRDFESRQSKEGGYGGSGYSPWRGDK